MSIQSNIPQITALRKRVEEQFGKKLQVHSDFLALSAEIETMLRQHISESTLERVWGYSTRGYNSISLRTLDVLATYAASCNWHHFCHELAEKDGDESSLFDVEQITTNELTVGDRLRIGWLPDRLCVVRYLGNNRFVAEECINSKIHPGDSFSCLHFSLGLELCMSDFRRHDSDTAKTYVVGSKHGLTTLQRIDK